MEEIYFCPNCMAKISAGDTKCPVCGGNVNVQNAAHQLPVNTILNGRYIIGKVLGEGGFGITYLGYDLQTDTKAAIKEYFPSGVSYRFSRQSHTVSIHDKDSGEQFAKGKERFLGEARTIYRFRDEENIVNVLDFFSENNTVYIVMEYIEGVSLGQYLSQNGRVGDFDELYKILRPVMVSLDHVHKAGLIHRDISPSNLMIDINGTVKLLDFGTARSMSEDGEKSLSVVLKHGFAPMEQYKTHGRQGAWTDVYALCATMYKLLTGQTPVSAMDRMDSEMPLPSALGVKISPAQEEILFKGLALSVKDRIQTVGELIALFDAASKPAEAEKKQPVNNAPKYKGKRQTENASAKKAPNKKAIYIIAAILALAVCISFFIFASPRHKIIASGSCGNNAGWSLAEDGTLTVSGTGAMEDYSDTSTQSWYEHADAINSVIISDGITNIGNRAFADCSSLTEITISDSVISIGEHAFSGCSALSEITIPGSVTSIQWGAFADCSALSEITIPDSVTSIGNWTFSGCSALTKITIPGSVTSIGCGAFADCSSLTEITIPNSVTSIDSDTFSGCSALSEITIPSSVTSIQWGAFSDCSALTKIIIPGSVTSISESAFFYCSALMEIAIPDSVTSIGYGAFSLCDNLSDVYYGGSESDWSKIEIYDYNNCLTNARIHFNSAMPSQGTQSAAPLPTPPSAAIIASGSCGGSAGWSLTEDGTLTVSGTGAMEDYSDKSAQSWCGHADAINSVIISDGISHIGNRAFYGCSSLTEIALSNSVTNIGKFAFYGCKALTEITISNSVANIGGDAFFGCSALSEITIPNSVTSIWWNAFSGCTSLTKITIPDSVTSIRGGAFDGCYNLSDVYYGGSESDWSKIKIYDSNNCLTNAKIHFNSAMPSQGTQSAAPLPTPPSAAIIASGSCGGSAGWSLTEDGTLTVSGTGAMEDYSDKSAQSWCGHADAINSVIISDGISHIGNRAFYGCSSLTEIALSNSVTNIGKFAFYGCKALTEITISNSVANIGGDAFFGCSALSEITIPNSVTSIWWNAFSGCTSLTKITIPDSVTSIRGGAFDGCYNLSDVYYGGSESDWSKIKIYDSNNCLTNAKIHFNSAMPET